MSKSPPNDITNDQAAPALFSFHSTKASAIMTQYSSQSAIYQALTFPTLLVAVGQIIPVVLAVEENFECLQIDVQRFAPLLFGFGLPNLRVMICGVFDVCLHAGNSSAVLRYIKDMRAGVDGIVVEPQRGILWTRAGEEVRQDGLDHFGFDRDDDDVQLSRRWEGRLDTEMRLESLGIWKEYMVLKW